ncbi:hypothetical protein ACFFSY_18030 [Paenibacillus aurantiacus]|uniref:PPM-type phosphatase domain-containing protein n=1 Tax=Paenibacillus aurantiacus TaxID=1936118 RepID=A0ABV5KRI8_9BACL
MQLRAVNVVTCGDKIFFYSANRSVKGCVFIYKSVVRDGKFLVVVTDGIYDSPLIELPTEEIADKVAYELQSAWDQGVVWGTCQKSKELDNTDEMIQKLLSLSPEEREVYIQKIKRRSERMRKIEEARRWESVLSWKRKMEE